jgi:phenylacetate-coenzyme A ligase PaaK-like adenylate-forming protein
VYLLERIEQIPPFSLNKNEKDEFFFNALENLHQFHLDSCSDYKKITSIISKNKISIVEDFPFLPVRLFKEFELISVDKASIKKIMSSSGTSGTIPSKIFLDADTAIRQTKVLTKILNSYLGNKRLPMLIIDSRAVLKNRSSFSARAAGILGFSMFGLDIHYALDEDMNIDIPAIIDFINKYNGQNILVFGFTFIVWEYFINKLKMENVKLKLLNSTLIHGGGWKKLIDKAVDNVTFKNNIFEWSGIDKVYNYYGLVEQTGSIFMECEAGVLHSSIYSDIIIRNHKNFSVCKLGEEGIVQLISLLPISYPGHSILTEDLGVLIGIDDCTCGRKGKYFKINGRIKNAEVRGCSDTLQK